MHPPPRSHRARARVPHPGVPLATLLAAGVLLPALVMPTSQATFTATAPVSDNQFSAAVLAAPTGLETAATGGQITLTWKATASAAADGYKVYRASADTGPWAPVGTVTGVDTTTFTDSAPLPGTNYYLVRAYRMNWLSGTTDVGQGAGTYAWVNKTPMPVTNPRYLAAAADNNGNIYVTGNGSTATYRYSTVSDTWTTVAPNSIAKGFHGMASDTQGRVYAIGGGSDAVNRVERYDPATNTWTTVAAMLKARRDHAVTTDPSGRIYAVGGYNNADGIMMRHAERYDPATNKWTAIAAPPTNYINPAVAADSSGRIYVIRGGQTTVDRYHPATNTWTTVAPLPRLLYSAQVVADSQGYIYVIGGNDRSTGEILKTVYRYDPATNSWSTGAPMNTGRYSHALTRVGAHLYAIGGTGAGGTYLNSVEQFDPTWAQQ